MFTIAFSFVATAFPTNRPVTLMTRATGINACSVVYQLGCLVYVQVTNFEPSFFLDGTFAGFIVVA